MQDIRVQIEEMRGHMASSGTQPRIEQRNVLTAVVGNTPAVVTETLWALDQHRAIRVDEIRIITTAVGRDSIARYLLGPDGHFAKYCHDYGLAAGRIAFSAQNLYVIADNQGKELQDIRNSDDNQAAADQIFALIQGWASRKEERLLCSVAGGRKTLGIYLAMAMMLCGRPDDAVYHVLVAPEFEAGVPDFFYPPSLESAYQRRAGVDEAGRPVFKPISSGDAQVDLADIPFPRLRDALGGDLPFELGLTQAIAHSRLLLSYIQSPPPLTVDLHNRTVTVGEFTFALSRQLLAVYLFFLEYCNGGDWLPVAELYPRRSLLSELERRIDRLRLGEAEAYTWDKLRDPEEFRSRVGPCISKVNGKIRTALGANRLAARYQIATGGSYGVNGIEFHIVDYAKDPSKNNLEQ
ncbi:MAG TPA: TIGR02584 family CRISPR-associated protein, partial [Syntrophobacteraceae bacterium]|nr:TIGR02584 family CRISPR-associated protein [Syntrophobacteraceae bacterium]